MMVGRSGTRRAGDPEHIRWLGYRSSRAKRRTTLDGPREETDRRRSPNPGENGTCSIGLLPRSIALKRLFSGAADLTVSPQSVRGLW
jgi:hypothetical protein